MRKQLVATLASCKGVAHASAGAPRYSARAFADPQGEHTISLVVMFNEDPDQVARRNIELHLADLRQRAVPYQILRHHLGPRVLVVHLPFCEPFAFLCFVNTATAIVLQGAPHA